MICQITVCPGPSLFGCRGASAAQAPTGLLWSSVATNICQDEVPAKVRAVREWLSSTLPMPYYLALTGHLGRFWSAGRSTTGGRREGKVLGVPEDERRIGGFERERGCCGSGFLQWGLALPNEEGAVVAAAHLTHATL